MKSYLAYFDRSSRPRRRYGCRLLALALLVGACQPAKAFECSKDSDCSLGGEAGICTPTGRCAYPQEACASGFAYPEGAGKSLGGVCLPPGVVGGATDSAGTDTDTDTDTDPLQTGSDTGGDTGTSAATLPTGSSTEPTTPTAG